MGVYKMDSEKRIVALKLKTTSKGVPSPEQPPQEESAPAPVIVTEEKASAEAQLKSIIYIFCYELSVALWLLLMIFIYNLFFCISMRWTKAIEFDVVISRTKLKYI